MKYIIEIEDKPVERIRGVDFGAVNDEIYFAKNFKSLVFDEHGLSMLTPLTDEVAIDHLRSTGWMQAHDKALTSNVAVDEIVAAERCGAKKAWALAQRITKEPEDGGMTNEELSGCFGVVSPTRIMKQPYYEAAEKYEKWAEKRMVFEVGDEVVTGYGKKGVIITVYNDTDTLCVMFSDNKKGIESKESCTKTGRRYPKFAEMLDALREEDA